MASLWSEEVTSQAWQQPGHHAFAQDLLFTVLLQASVSPFGQDGPRGPAFSLELSGFGRKCFVLLREVSL